LGEKYFAQKFSKKKCTSNSKTEFHTIHQYLKCNVNAAAVQRVLFNEVIALRTGH
jgi:hypothetical protein